MGNKTINLSEFARSFRLRPDRFAWLLGAGASAAAGIPTGYDMITDFKKQLYCQLSGTPAKEVDATDPLWVERINAYLELKTKLPPTGDPSEYAAVFATVYPSAEDRRRYIEKAVGGGSPSFGHRVLAALIATKNTPCIFTTNFDQLIERAAVLATEALQAADRPNLVVAAIDNSARADLCLRESNWPLLAKLHGDFQSADLKNTSEELQSQDASMRTVLTRVGARFGLVVVGYSGRDQSVMDALKEVARNPGGFPGGIYWVTKSAQTLLPAVKELLGEATVSGVNATIVECHNFDELAAEIAEGLDLPEAIAKHVFDKDRAKILRPCPLPKDEARKFPVLQCSAVPILSLPASARRISLSEPQTIQSVRSSLKEANVRAIVACVGSDVIAFGNDSEMVAALSPFGARPNGTVSLSPIEDTSARGLIYDALIRAVCRNNFLMPRMSRRGHAALVAPSSLNEPKERSAKRDRHLLLLRGAYSASLTGTVTDLGLPFYEGIRVRLDHLAGRWWLAFEPATFVDLPLRDESSPSDMSRKRPDPSADWRRERWATRYNKSWAAIVNAWSKLICQNGNGLISALGIDEDAGADAQFQLSPITGWSRPAHIHHYFDRAAS